MAALTGEENGFAPTAVPDRLRAASRRAAQWRRAQRQIFPKAALNESCWDILLLCFVGQVGGRSICVKQIRNELDESNTSVLRRLQELEQAGLITRRRDELDGRRTIVALSMAGANAMLRYFELLAEDSGVPGATA